MKSAIRLASCALTGLVLAAPAVAQQPADTGPANPQGVQPPPGETASETQFSDGPASAHLLGNLGGMRTTLHDMGIDIRANLINEFAGNTSGGLSQGGRNAGEFNFGSDLDLGRMGLDPGGSVHITFTQRYGYSLSQQVIGNLVSVQEIYGTGQNFLLAEGRSNSRSTTTI